MKLTRIKTYAYLKGPEGSTVVGAGGVKSSTLNGEKVLVSIYLPIVKCRTN